jgi:hypothetical protein
LAIKPTLPPTAIIDDKTDTFVMGGLLIIIGMGLIVYIRGQRNLSY